MSIASQISALATRIATEFKSVRSQVDRYSGINAQTGTTYTVVAADENKLVTCNNAAAITVTLPQDSALTFPVGARIDFVQLGAGQVTFTNGTGATVNGTPTKKLRAQYSAASIIKIAANTWLVAGDVAAS